MKISTPTLVLDKQKALNNIQKMAKKAIKNDLMFRPHFKTHQSLEIGSWFKAFPIDGITVSSLKMAEYFAQDGWDSITIAFPINILELDRIDILAQKIDLRILAVDLSVLRSIENKLSAKLGIYIEIDPGYGRSGVSISDNEKINELINLLNKSKVYELKGFYCHAGHTYNCKTTDEILKTSDAVVNQLSMLKANYNIPICFGDTPSCSVLTEFGAIDEISPGNFVFYDWNQTCIGSCIPNDIAVAMYCPVVAKYESRNELLIHGGAVHFSKDYESNGEGLKYFGQPVESGDKMWGSIIEGSYLKSISQEHGIVKCTSDFFETVNIGDVIPILPIHSCLTADAMGSYSTTNGEFISHLSIKKI